MGRSPLSRAIEAEVEANLNDALRDLKSTLPGGIIRIRHQALAPSPTFGLGGMEPVSCRNCGAPKGVAMQPSRPCEYCGS